MVEANHSVLRRVPVHPSREKYFA